MDKQIQKLKSLVDIFLHQSRADILKECGNPLKNSDNEIWFYNQYNWGIFKSVTGFIFEEDRVVDIVIMQYIFWKEYQNIFYYEGQNPEYKVIQF